MQIANLKLKNFRSWKNLNVDFESKINIFFGPNGSGKTNIIESIYILSKNKSFKQLKNIADIINSDSDHCDIFATLIHNSKKNVSYSLKRDSKPVKKIPFQIPIILFSFYDTNIVNLDPANRRKFIDDLIKALYPNSRNFWTNYKKVLAQKNALLKQNKISNNDKYFGSTLKIFNEQLVSNGTQIIKYRKKVLSNINSGLNDIYKNISQNDDFLEIKYYDYDFKNEIEKHYTLEVKNGISVVGPHLDDFDIILNGLLSKSSASTGEIWSIVLSMRIASYYLMEQLNPIILLDDVFSQIDNVRKEKLSNFLQKIDEQIIITTAEKDDIPNVFLSNDTKLFNILEI